jgi:hypothetical protein
LRRNTVRWKREAWHSGSPKGVAQRWRDDGVVSLRGIRGGTVDLT